MSREIKFRAWDSNGGYFKPIDDDGDYYFRDDGDGLVLCDKWGECKDTVLLQYTGLKDKNGKEIYEGDIIETSYGKVGTVVYYERSASFIVNDPNHFNEQLWHDAANSEVIGNIHEQPELLTESKNTNNE